MRVKIQVFAVSLLSLLGCGGAPGSGSDATTDAVSQNESSVSADANSSLEDVVQSDVQSDAQTLDAVSADTAMAPEASAPDASRADAAADAVAGPYPAGPYGNNQGDVLANLEWDGYVNTTGERVSTMLPFAQTNLQALRGSGRGYALIHLSEFL